MNAAARPAHSQSVAIVGSGISGITAAWLLQQRYEVTLFEAEERLGGHTRTVEVPSGPDQGIRVDTGFIVMNHRNYPVLTRLFQQWDVPLEDSDMSFSYTNLSDRYTYAGTNLNTLFSDRRNVMNPGHWRMIADILKFNRAATEAIETGTMPDGTLEDYVNLLGLRTEFKSRYLYPMGAAIWSSPGLRIEAFPAAAFIGFFYNHGLLSVKGRPQWKYVKGGSAVYLDKFKNAFKGTVRTGAAVSHVMRSDDQVTLSAADRGRRECFDAIVSAVHADQVLPMLDNPTPVEEQLFGKWTYHNNEVTLHCDGRQMPPNRRSHASWNVMESERHADQPVSMTYDMNRLQRHVSQKPLLVTLNRDRDLSDPEVYDRALLSHPCYTAESMATRAGIQRLSGDRRSYYCGAWMGYGFHEDGARSAVEALAPLGVELL